MPGLEEEVNYTACFEPVNEEIALGVRRVANHVVYSELECDDDLYSLEYLLSEN